jgi:hypothetical protein
MKTPTALFLGLALIAAAIFFREPSIKPAHAATPVYVTNANEIGMAVYTWAD